MPISSGRGSREHSSGSDRGRAVERLVPEVADLEAHDLSDLIFLRNRDVGERLSRESARDLRDDIFDVEG